MSELPTITTPELLRLSPFDLPEISVPEAERALLSPRALKARVRVPGCSHAQLRTLQGRGYFDEPVINTRHKENGGPIVLFRPRPPRRSGETELRPVMHVAILRLIGWLRRDGIPDEDIWSTLRGQGLLAGTLVVAIDEPGAMLQHVDGLGFGAVVTPEQAAAWDAEYGSHGVKRFPLLWLGMYNDVLPRAQKFREQRPEVWRWGKTQTPAEIAASSKTLKR